MARLLTTPARFRNARVLLVGSRRLKREAILPRLAPTFKPPHHQRHSAAPAVAGYKADDSTRAWMLLIQGYTGLADPDPKPANREHTGLT
jgi:hypothetical protein